jgi:hypothetical protein
MGLLLQLAPWRPIDEAPVSAGDRVSQPLSLSTSHDTGGVVVVRVALIGCWALNVGLRLSIVTALIYPDWSLSVFRFFFAFITLYSLVIYYPAIFHSSHSGRQGAGGFLCYGFSTACLASGARPTLSIGVPFGLIFFELTKLWRFKWWEKRHVL